MAAHRQLLHWRFEMINQSIGADILRSERAYCIQSSSLKAAQSRASPQVEGLSLVADRLPNWHCVASTCVRCLVQVRARADLLHSCIVRLGIAANERYIYIYISILVNSEEKPADDLELHGEATYFFATDICVATLTNCQLNLRQESRLSCLAFSNICSAAHGSQLQCHSGATSKFTHI